MNIWANEFAEELTSQLDLVAWTIHAAVHDISQGQLILGCGALVSNSWFAISQGNKRRALMGCADIIGLNPRHNTDRLSLSLTQKIIIAL